MAEGARLESVYTSAYRGFESLPLRQIKKGCLIRQPFFIGGEGGRGASANRSQKSQRENPNAHGCAGAVKPKDGRERPPSPQINKPPLWRVFCTRNYIKRWN